MIVLVGSLDNFWNFRSHSKNLRTWGFDVYCPVEVDLQQGWNPDHYEMTDGLRRMRLSRDMAQLCRASGIALMPNWDNDPCARILHAAAIYLDLMVIDAETGRKLET